MRKLLFGVFFTPVLSFAQVGINTPNPASTLDIVAKNPAGNATNVDGLLVPRVDRLRAQNMKSVPTSTMIYVNSVATGSQAGIAINIDSVGYYYFDGTVWVKLATGVGNAKKAVNYVVYNLNNMRMDWISDFNTNIDANRYTVAVVGQKFKGSPSNNNMETLTPATGIFNPVNVFAYQSGGTWRLSADYDGAHPVGKVNGLWTIYCLVIDNSIVNSLGTIQADLHGAKTGSAPAPAGL